MKFTCLLLPLLALSSVNAGGPNCKSQKDCDGLVVDEGCEYVCDMPPRGDDSTFEEDGFCNMFCEEGIIHITGVGDGDGEDITCMDVSECPTSTDQYCGWDCLDGKCAMWCAGDIGDVELEMGGAGPGPCQTDADCADDEKCNLDKKRLRRRKLFGGVEGVVGTCEAI
eukprot:CAMPEP_0118652048 /NCGR_PEP_ID=MMETSP0785-20121206/11109_1 /TAXON_ID=91992 /ORGANISM="Bolidomonas pacifica, Strain CCMP 1866" /LENGTH=167 /DNA_ID=CAMNT_0006544537 /DNA_START=83 /DNA_END=586 /DNA_ORIENTATION=+